jgi:single-strand DNA-binding protein
MLNKCMVIGHLGADPEMRYLASGAAVTQFSVATSRKYKTGDGEQREETEWFRVVTWNRLAETCAQYLTKGRLVYVEGRLQTRSWDGDDGQKHYMTELVAENVKFLGGARSEHEAGPVLAATGGAGGDIDPDNLPF